MIRALCIFIITSLFSCGSPRQQTFHLFFVGDYLYDTVSIKNAKNPFHDILTSKTEDAYVRHLKYLARPNDSVSIEIISINNDTLLQRLNFNFQDTNILVKKTGGTLTIISTDERLEFR